jgi:hypothetical protein
MHKKSSLGDLGEMRLVRMLTILTQKPDMPFNDKARMGQIFDARKSYIKLLGGDGSG